ncbi:HAMP domain-containing histidine kinase [Bacillus sp. AGMB 02131]|uniref:histidine kinase n=1 Tax=Peribacillus faecalis TaxID=2772559 RepID=A0A927CVN0_9BACI|nr:HAMP domain-containing histidine kinase [Peribacillus faecalis]
MNNIINVAELQKDMDENCAELMDIIIHHAYTINSLLDGLRDLSNIHLLKDQTEVLNREMCPIENIEKILDYFEDTYPDRGFVLEIQKGFNNYIKMEPALFRLVMQNLIGNAVKFADCGTPIIIRISSNTRHEIELAVENRGPTISLEDQEKIFEKYYRIRNTKKQVSGSGLGLWIVKEIVNVYNGQVYARSTKDSTIVTILLQSYKRE